MTDLIGALKRLKVQTGSLSCLGCGHEHNCSVHGCAIIREAIEELEGRTAGWIDDCGDGDSAICSNCGECFDTTEGGFDLFCQLYCYCPCCGARMEVPHGAD